MPKNIVILADGTGNSAASLAKTNVWRLYRALDLSSDPPTQLARQVAIYRDGVGTSSFKPLALLGGIFGLGLSRNVIELYKFLCRTYEAGDRIYAFGFSRGAFTIRVLVAFVLNQGVLRCQSEEDLDRYAADAYRSYRRRYKLPLCGSKRDYENSDAAQLQTVGLVDRLRNARDGIIRLWRWITRTPQYQTVPHAEVETIRFVGVWDTVAAYGLPVDELTRGIDEWVWPLSMPNYTLSAKVETARHALALDEERDSFRPLLWDEGPEDELARAGVTRTDRLKQVWFAGVHSNVGGGYADDTLSYVPLTWMIEEANAAGLRFNEQALCETYPPPNPLGRLYDSRAGIASYYRYQPRRLSAYLLKPKEDTRLLRDPRRGRRGFLRDIFIHDSVIQRITRGRDHYAPVSLNDSFQVVRTLGQPNNHVLPSLAPAQSPLRQWLWNDVWRRRVGYFGTILLSLSLVTMPFIQRSWPPTACEGPQCFLSGPIRAVGGVLPNVASPWIDAFARSPGTFLVIAAAISLLLGRSSTLKQRVRDDARALWLRQPDEQGAAPTSDVSRGRWDQWICKLRTREAYQRTFQALKWVILPNAFGVGLLLILLAGGLGGIYLTGARAYLARLEQTDAICDLVKADLSDRLGEGEFATKATCWNTIAKVEKDRRYRLAMVVTKPWVDLNIPTNPSGFENDRMPWYGKWSVVLRRSLNDRWLQPILRLRRPDGHVHLKALDLSCAADCASDYPTFMAEFDAPVTGNVGLFLNDAAIGFWGLTPFFYRNNEGAAKLGLTELSPGGQVPSAIAPAR